MCDNCTSLVTCIRDEDGYHKLPLQTCSPGESCLRSACTSDRNPRCEPELPFPCNDIGVFPNPYLCRIYHFCVPNAGQLVNYRVECDGSFGYHAGTTFCQNRLDDYVCSEDELEFPVDLCLNPGQTNALPDNESIYYICAPFNATHPVLYPFLFVCPHGGRYWNYECHVAAEDNYHKIMSRF